MKSHFFEHQPPPWEGRGHHREEEKRGLWHGTRNSDTHWRIRGSKPAHGRDLLCPLHRYGIQQHGGKPHSGDKQSRSILQVRKVMVRRQNPSRGGCGCGPAFSWPGRGCAGRWVCRPGPPGSDRRGGTPPRRRGSGGGAARGAGGQKRNGGPGGGGQLGISVETKHMVKVAG